MLIISVTLVFAFLNRTLAILLPPANPAINLAVGSSAPSLNALNATSGPSCDSNHYGFNLNRRSCVEAVERLALSSTFLDKSVVYVNRDKDISGVRIVLPWRELSSDGTCAVDVMLKPGVAQDRSTTQPIYNAATRILDTCVAAEGNVGGSVSNLGENGNLRVSIKQYEGPLVYCNDPARAGGGSGITSASCRSVLSFMPVDYGLKIYGPAGDSTADVIIPKTFGSIYGTTCGVTLSSFLPSVRRDQATNWDVWAAAVKVDAMCVRRGLSGIASGFGSRKALRVSLLKTVTLASNSTGVGLGSISPEGLSEQ